MLESRIIYMIVLLIIAYILVLYKSKIKKNNLITLMFAVILTIYLVEIGKPINFKFNQYGITLSTNQYHNKKLKTSNNKNKRGISQMMKK